MRQRTRSPVSLDGDAAAIIARPAAKPHYSAHRTRICLRSTDYGNVSGFDE